MFELHGFTLATFACLLGGIYVHALKQLRTAKANGAKVTHRAYFGEHMEETITSAVCSAVLWAGLPEIAMTFPSVAEKLSLGNEVGVISSFGCGIVGNSFADFLGGRAKSIAGGK